MRNDKRDKDAILAHKGTYNEIVVVVEMLEGAYSNGMSFL